MKTILATLTATLMICTATAAPSITPADISEDSLKEIATDRQKASLERLENARKEAAKARAERDKQAEELTKKNNEGLKETLRRRHLNSMLPPCDREPETPNNPKDYRIRY